MKAYYAHFMGIYDTPQETRDIVTLEKMGFDVLNPNTKEFQAAFHGAKMDGFDYMAAFNHTFFKQGVDVCEVFAFRGLPDGRIPGGVAMELRRAQVLNKLIIELPCGTNSRSMGKEETREYLRDIGQR